MDSLVCHHLDADHAVVELPELAASPAPLLELHIVRDSETGVAVAWWTDDQALWRWVVEPAKA